MVKFIDDEKQHYGVESICRILPIAPSTYYRIKDEQENPEKQSRRKQSDKHLIAQIKQIWQDSGCRYGIRKVWHKLKQDGLPKLGRCTVERLMKKLGIQGVWRGKGKTTTKQRDDQDKSNDLVKRNFSADSPNLAKQCFSGWLILPTSRLKQAGSIPPLLLTCLSGLLSVGRYQPVWTLS